MPVLIVLDISSRTAGSSVVLVVCRDGDTIVIPIRCNLLVSHWGSLFPSSSVLLILLREMMSPGGGGFYFPVVSDDNFCVHLSATCMLSLQTL